MDELTRRLARSTLELCAVPSVTGDEKALCDLLEPALCRFFPGAVLRIGNTLVAGSLDDPRPMVALFGHLDTVPGRPGDGPARLDGDRVIGLGASDMKSGVAVMLALAEDLGIARLPCNPVFVFYDREEGPYEGNGLGPALAALPALGRAALAICLESSDLEIQVGCLGSLHGRVVFRGKAAHSARPWQGENAIHAAAGLLSELAASERRRVEVDGFEFFEVVCATQAAGGTARNVVPERFEVNLNYRFAPGKGLDQAADELVALVAGRAEVEIVDRSPAGRVCAGNPTFQKLLAVTGARASSKQAWTDVGRLSAHGIDAVNYGPGLTSQAHQAGEYVPAGNLARCYRALRGFLEAP